MISVRGRIRADVMGGGGGEKDPLIVDVGRKARSEGVGVGVALGSNRDSFGPAGGGIVKGFTSSGSCASGNEGTFRGCASIDGGSSVVRKGLVGRPRAMILALDRGRGGLSRRSVSVSASGGGGDEGSSPSSSTGSSVGNP